MLGILVLAKGDRRLVMESKVSNKFCNITSPLILRLSILDLGDSWLLL